MSLIFTPVPSTEAFFTSEKFISFICGPVGSSKTTSAIVKLLYHAGHMARAKDGFRRSRCIFVRNTREQLRDTSIPDFLKWFPDGEAGTYYKSEMRFELSVGDIRCDVLFRGLDDAQDVRRLLSLQASFAIIDEFRELNKDIFEALQARLGRYPDGMMVPHKPEWGTDDKGNPRMGCVMDDGTPNARLWGASNPPDMDTYFEGLLTNPPSNTHVTIQPSGTSPEADWLHLLPSGYYETLATGKSEEYIDIYIHAKFGKSLSGQPVWKSFDSDFHIAKGALRPILNGVRPVLIGMDFGLNPSAVIGQLDMQGRLLVMGEATSDGMGVLRFVRTILKPLLAQNFPGAPILVIGDPAGRSRVQTDEKTVYDILKAEGFTAISAHTNSLIARIGAVDQFLNRQVDGGAGFLVDNKCLNLIGGLRGKYRYKAKKTGEMDDEPEKNMASHICFVAGTRVATPDGATDVDLLRVGDLVETPIGPRRVTAVHSRVAPVVRAELSDGLVLEGTPDHPILTQRGWVALDALQYSDILDSIHTRSAPWLQNIRFRFSTAFGSIAKAGGTTKLVMRSLAAARSTCTGTCGSSTTGQYPPSTTCTTTMETPATTALKTLPSCSAPTTAGNMPSNASPTVRSVCPSIWQRPGSPLRSGMVALMDWLGTGSTGNLRGLGGKSNSMSAHSAVSCTTALPEPASGGSAPPVVRAWPESPAELMTKRARAWFAVQSSKRTSTGKQKHALRCVQVLPLAQPACVYAIAVEGAGAYYANGVLVSNCDALQYLALHADGQQSGAYMGNTVREVERVNIGAWT
jgi:hypothetical protein